jgi:quercetin dioxygenase-like cupin family protein
MTDRIADPTDASGTDRPGRPPRTLEPALTVTDLVAEGRTLRADERLAEHGRVSKTLLKTDPLRVVLSALRSGAWMENDDPDEIVTLQGLDGSVTVSSGAGPIVVGAGELVALADGQPWRLEAIEDSLVLLVVGRAAARPADVGQESPGG